MKPAAEFIALARKPLTSTVAGNVQRWGTGAINIDGCRIETDDVISGGLHAGGSHDGWDRPFMHDTDAQARIAERKAANLAKATRLGRWPANIVHDGSDEVLAVFPQQTSGANPTRRSGLGYHGADGQAECDAPRGADSGSAARFFYCAKADKRERDEGLYDAEPVRRTDGRTAESDHPRLSPQARRNFHPTVKPLDLMRWLVRLVTPPDGVVLDPFMGSGTTLKAARAEGHRSIGIDLERDHCDIAWGRLSQGVLL